MLKNLAITSLVLGLLVTGCTAEETAVINELANDTAPTTTETHVDTKMEADEVMEQKATSDAMESDTEVKEVKPEANTQTTVTFANYSKADYEKALAEGKTVALNFHANWCPTCKANEPHLNAAAAQLNDPNFVSFRVDYDNETELKKEFGITSQSTIVIVKNGNPDNTVRHTGLIQTDEALALFQA